MSSTMVTYTMFRNAGNAPLGKRYILNFADQLEKETSAQMVRGQAERREVTFLDFVRDLEAHGPDQARAYGTINQSVAAVVTKAELLKNPSKADNRIARDREHVTYKAGPAILLIDYDPAKGTTPKSADELRDRVIEVVSEAAGAPMAIQASSSAYIFHGDDQLQGPKGWHLYILVANGTDIPRVINAIFDKSWIHGHGFYLVSKAGTPLERSLIDKSVSPPEHLDFAAAYCEAPLEQRRPAVQTWNLDAAPFDTRLVADLTAEEKLQIAQKRMEAKAAIEPERRRVRDAWVGERTKEMEERGVDSVIALRTAENAVDSDALLGDFELISASGRKVCVGEILANRKDHHGTRFRDPLEPEYPDARIAYANLFGGRPYIFSHAHGGRRYYLYPQTRVLKLQAELPPMMDAVLELMRLAGDVFDQPKGNGENALVYVHNGRLIQLTLGSLRTYIGRLARCVRYDKRSKSWEPASVPKDLVDAIYTATTQRRLPQLEAVIKSPVMRPDGSILDEPGYHAADRILFESDDLFPTPIPRDPTTAEISTAIESLWRPFRDFPFVDDVARGVMLAALLTAVVRPMLETSPGFLFGAPTLGSGKTLLGKCACRLIGVNPPIAAPPPDDTEAKKTLLAELRNGALVIFWDNYIEPIYGNAAISAFLTTPLYSSRILGVSEMGAYANRALLIMTGNNPRVEGDATRRILQCRLDAQMERPSLRTFEMDPELYVRENRQLMHAAALTVLRGFYARGAPKQTADTAGSFEQWDRMVRQCVIWIGRSGLTDVGLGDPYASALESMDHDPAADTVFDVMTAIQRVNGDAYRSPKDILAALEFDDTAREALSTIDPKGLNPVRFSGWLQKHRDRIIEGLTLRREKNSHTKNYQYAVVAAKPAARIDNLDLIGDIGGAT